MQPTKGDVMLIQIRQKAYSAYRSLPILGPIVDEFTDWAHHCGYEVKSFRSQLAGGTGTDDGNCLTALAEPHVRCLLEGLKPKIGGRFFDLRSASSVSE
jgi:hypothetical protein